MLHENFLEIRYTTPTGCRGCYRFLVNTNEYINNSFFATKTQTELRKVFEIVTWSEDATENFRAIKNFYIDAIGSAKKHGWYLFMKSKENFIDRKIKKEKKAIGNKKLWSVTIRNIATKNIEQYQKEKENLNQTYAKFLKYYSKERRMLKKLERNYRFFLKFIEKLNSGKKRRKAA